MLHPGLCCPIGSVNELEVCDWNCHTLDDNWRCGYLQHEEQLTCQHANSKALDGGGYLVYEQFDAATPA